MRGSDAQPQANELMAVRKDIWRYKREAEEAKVNLRKAPAGRVLGAREQPPRHQVFAAILLSSSAHVVSRKSRMQTVTCAFPEVYLTPVPSAGRRQKIEGSMHLHTMY